MLSACAVLLVLAQGRFSAQATALGNTQAVTVASPDNQSFASTRWIGVLDKDDRVRVDVRGAAGTLHFDIGLGLGSEILWAPDSKAFFITTSDDGASGMYRLIVVDRLDGRLRAVDLSPLIDRTFGHPNKCGWDEEPNVGGIGWVGASHHVLVAAEVYPHSNCDSFGTFVAYEVDPRQMTFVRRYGQIEAKRRFGPELGLLLVDAPDQCVQDRRSCFVQFNHREKSSP